MKTFSPKGVNDVSGNEACAEGAITAGPRFYPGYPITPSGKLMERMSVRLNDLGGIFMQMEDETVCPKGAIKG
jgi:2-oxoglutarate/2-oxoacid ferredoxin oxidoreductase subunit alpha